MSLSTNLNQVNTIITDLANNVNKDHVGALNSDGGVTKTTTSCFTRIVHWFKTKFNNPDVVQENRAILNSYKEMLKKNMGEVYSTLFSNRVRNVEASGSYKIGRDLSRELQSIVTQYKTDMDNNEKVLGALEKAYELTDSDKFKGIFNERFALCLSSRKIPIDDEGIRALGMDVDANKLFRAKAQDFFLRNDREPNDEEINKMLDAPLQTVFTDVNIKNCNLLCSKYKFIDANSNDSIDVKLKSALTAKGINMDIPKEYLDRLVGEVKEKMRNFGTYVKISDVKNLISSVVKYAVNPSFNEINVDENIDKIFVKNMVSANVSSKMHETLRATTNELVDVIQELAKNSISTAMLKSGLNTACKAFHEACNALDPASKPNAEQQNAIFSAAAKSAIDICLLDTPEMLETRTQLLNHCSTLIGASSPFINIMYELSTGTLANTNPDSAKMLTFCRSMVSTLHEAITSETANAVSFQAKISTTLAAKKQELTDSIKSMRNQMWNDPAPKPKAKEGSQQGKINHAIEDLMAAKAKALANPEATQIEKDTYIAKIDELMKEIQHVAPNRVIEIDLDLAAVNANIKEIARLQGEISTKERELSTLKEDDNTRVPLEAKLVEFREALLEEQLKLVDSTATLEKQGIDNFNIYIKEMNVFGETLLIETDAAAHEINKITEDLNQAKTRFEALNAKPNKTDPEKQLAETNAKWLELMEGTISEKTTKLQELIGKKHYHAQLMHNASALLETTEKLQKDITALQTQQSIQPLSAEDLEKNSTVVKYLSTGKDFGGLLDYETYKMINKSIPVHNDFGLTQQEKESFKQFTASVITDQATNVDTVGTTLDKRIAKLESDIAKLESNLALKSGGSEEEKTNLTNMQTDLRRAKRTPNSSETFHQTQHYTKAFIQNFDRGRLHLTIDGSEITPPNLELGRIARSNVYKSLNRIFAKPEIAGKVLAPFTHDVLDRLVSALARKEEKSPELGISDKAMDYHMTGDSVFSIDELSVNKLSDYKYNVTYFASGQKDNGNYAHHMFKFTVSNLDKAVPTYTIDDMDAIFHVVPYKAQAVPKEENNV